MYPVSDTDADASLICIGNVKIREFIANMPVDVVDQIHVNSIHCFWFVECNRPRMVKIIKRHVGKKNSGRCAFFCSPKNYYNSCVDVAGKKCSYRNCKMCCKHFVSVKVSTISTSSAFSKFAGLHILENRLHEKERSRTIFILPFLLPVWWPMKICANIQWEEKKPSVKIDNKSNSEELWCPTQL